MLSLLQHGVKTWMLWVVHLEMVSFAGSFSSDVYNFPMFGVFMYEDSNGPTPYGSVTFIKSRVVLCAAENLYQLSPNGANVIAGLDKNLYVLAGSDLLKPVAFYGNEQKAAVQQIIVGPNSNWLKELLGNGFRDDQMFRSKYKILTGADVTNKKELSMNAFGYPQWDVAILYLKESARLKWSAYVLPAPNSQGTLDFISKEWKFIFGRIEEAEKEPHKFEPCVVPGWSPIGNNDIIYHKVVYVRNKECAESICAEYPSTCLDYPIVNQHICFKSLSFADSCVLDQGAPVICKWHPTRIMGILVKAFDCGTKSLPSVFTTWYGALAFITLSNVVLDEKTPQLDDKKFTISN